MDLREMIGNPYSTKFDAFWSELGEYPEEIMMLLMKDDKKM